MKTTSVHPLYQGVKPNPRACKAAFSKVGKTLGLLTLLLGGAASSASADTTAQVTFNDLTAAALAGQQGGVDFSGTNNWTVTVGGGGINVVSGDLAAPTYTNTGYTLTQSGTPQHITSTGGATVESRALDVGLTNLAHPVWFSFLARVDAGGRAGISIDDPQSSAYNRVLVRTGTTTTPTGVQLYIDPSTSIDVPGTASLVGSNILVVGRLTYNTAGGSDTVDVWINPDVTSSKVFASSAGAGQGSSSMDFDTASSGATSPGIQWLGAVAYSGGHVDNIVMSDAANAYQMVTGYNPPAVCPTIVLGGLESALKGASYSQSITASGGTGPYSFAVTSGSLPAGMTLSSVGLLSGTPTTVGSYSFTVTATDANSCTGARAYALGVYGGGADNSANGTSWSGNTGVGFGNWSFASTTHNGNANAGYERDAAGNHTANNTIASDGSVWKLYAVGFNSSPYEEADAYRMFNTPLSMSGDTFSISFELQKGNSGVSTNGQVGFALRNGDVDGAGNFVSHARLQVYLQGNTNLWVQDAAGARQIGVAFTRYGYDALVALTGPDSYSLTITRYSSTGTSTNAPVTVTGTLAGSGPIDSFSLFNWNNDLAAGMNSDAYFNNVAYTASGALITNNITFQVDMTAQIAVGRFAPGSDSVEVRGSFNGWNPGQYMLTNNPSSASPNVYIGVVPVAGMPKSGETYKFVFTDSTWGTIWESGSPKSSTADSGAPDYNRFLQLSSAASTTLPVVAFDDKKTNDYVPADTAVTFAVNMTGAVCTDGHVYVEGDTIWINGDFSQWYAWYDPVNPTFPPAQYQLTETVSGSGIYTGTVTIPRGTPVAFSYKYGLGKALASDMGPRNIEPAGNHYRVLRSTASGSYTMPQDTFGVAYQEPLFGTGYTGAAQLTIGSAAGGKVMVSWLGRPGAHLQSAGSVTGPWVDHFETDGTNWAAGYSSTNGLVSQTNWPASGNAFFRMVKP